MYSCSSSPLHPLSDSVRGVTPRPDRSAHRSWAVLAAATLITACGIRLSACERARPVEHLPVRLWSCSSVERWCEVYARFKTVADCELYLEMIDKACDPPGPTGELRCRPVNPREYARYWFNECSEEDLVFEAVWDAGAWAR